MTAWADGPASLDDDILDLASLVGIKLDGHGDRAGGADDGQPIAWPTPDFGSTPLPSPFAVDALERAAFAAEQTGPTALALADWLASAREMALAARSSEDRTRGALYGALGRAWDFALAAAEAPEDFQELIADAGLTVQERAPMTPVVKLVFGADYDKTRLTEYAAALNFARRNGIERGGLAAYLLSVPGGLKGVVQAERRWRKEAEGQAAVHPDSPREKLARKLRQLPTQYLAELPHEGNEFAVLIARRLPTGEIVVVGEVPEDAALLERVARRLLE